MKLSDFRETLDELKSTNSRNDKKEIIRGVQDCPAAISFLSGSEFHDLGLGRKSVRKAADECFAYFEDDEPTLSESLQMYDESGSDMKLSELRNWLDKLDERSGNQQLSDLEQLFAHAAYPSVVSFAVLNDEATGVSDTTIANALDLKGALPFYDSVVDAVEAPNPIEEPMVHNAFDPMLAKSESSLPDDLSQYVGQVKVDGIRLILHIKSYKRGDADAQNVKAFTRRRNDVTESLPELDEIDFPHGDYILDCEVIAADGSYNTTTERIGRNTENVERETEMNFALFDVIEFASEPVYGKPYKQRYGLTTAFADLTPDERVGSLPIYTDIERAKEASSDYEGLIWKDINAPYQFGKRSKGWVKEKHQSENIDVRISGMVEGEGRLDGSMGKLSIESAEGEDVGHVGTGFSDKQRDEIWQNQDEWVGEVIEVEAEAYDSSLRFPRYKRDRRDDGSADSIEKIQSVMPEA